PRRLLRLLCTGRDVRGRGSVSRWIASRFQQDSRNSKACAAGHSYAASASISGGLAVAYTSSSADSYASYRITRIGNARNCFDAWRRESETRCSETTPAEGALACRERDPRGACMPQRV